MIWPSIQKYAHIFSIVFIQASYGFSWQVADPIPSQPNSVINDSWGKSFYSALAYDFAPSFVTNWPQWLMMHFPGYQHENNSAVDPGIQVQGSSQNDYLAPPNGWGFYANDLRWQSPLTLAPMPWSSQSYGWVGLTSLQPTAYFSSPNGSLWAESHRSNTNRAQEFSLFYDNFNHRQLNAWLSHESKPNSFSVWMNYDLGDTSREQTQGHNNHIMLQYGTQASNYRENWLFQWNNIHANYNQTIPLELYQVAPNGLYVGPNFVDDSVYRGQWHLSQILTDDSIINHAIDMQIYHQNGEFTHPLNLSTSCSNFSNRLCLSSKALVTQGNVTINPTDVGSPRSYALDSQSQSDTEELNLNHHVEIDSPYQHQQTGVRAQLVHTDYVMHHYLAQLDAKRQASDVKNAGNLVELGGLKSSTSSTSSLSSLSPVNATQKTLDALIYSQHRWQVSPLVQLSFQGQWHNTAYDTKDHRDNSGFEGASVSGEHYFHRLNPSLGLTYQVQPNAYAYGNVYQANIPPSPKLLACSQSSSPCYWPGGFYQDGDLSQTIDQGLHIGFVQKQWRVLSGWKWGVSGHWQRHNDDIILVPTDWMQGYARNVDRTERIYSLLDFHWMQRKWRVDGNYQYQHAYYASDFTVEKAYASGNQNVKSGDPMPGLPAHQLRLNLGYQWSPSLTLGGDFLAVTPSTYYGNFTGEKTQQDSGVWQLTDVPGYGVINTDITWHPSYQLTMQFKLKNALDKHYFNAASYGSAPSSAYVPFSELGDTGSGTVQGIDDSRFVMPGQERTWSILVKFSF